jgi:proline iminopeptidase
VGEKLLNKEGYLVINGVSHWYKIEGSQHKTTPIVIMHGGPGGNQYALERTIGPTLAEQFTVIYYEQRGSGRSSRPKNSEDYSIAILVEDLEVLRRELQIEKMYLLGTSFGSWIAMEYAISHANRVEKLILQGPVDGNWQRLSINQIWGLYHSAGENIREKIFRIISGNETIEEKKEKVWSLVDEETIARFSIHNHKLIPSALHIMRESRKYGFNENFHNAITKTEMTFPALIDKIEGIVAPTMVIVGLYDRNTGVEMSRDISERIPNSTLKILYNSAHYPECEELENYSAEIINFINNYPTVSHPE